MGTGDLLFAPGGGMRGNVFINGNVGIGTANPTATLDVSGSINANGSIDTSDLRINNSKIHIGTNAGLTNQGASSIAIGDNAGTTNQSANSIQINATGTTISQATASTCIIAPIRQTNQITTHTSLPLLYSNTTNEVFMNTREYITVSTGNTPNTSYYNSFLFIGAANSTPGIINIPTAVSGFPATITIWNNSAVSHTITSAGGNINTGYGTPSTAYTLKLLSSVILQTSGTQWYVVSNSGGNPVSNSLTAIGTTASSDTTTGALVVGGGAGIAGRIYAGGIITTTTTTVSGNTTTGALVVGGGAGIAGAVNIGGALALTTDNASKPTTNTWTISSDRRIKEDITDANLDLCYSIAKNLKLRRFKWKDYIGYEGDKHVVGYIAQEVQEIFPKAVDVSKKILEKKNENGEIVQEEIEDFLSLNTDQILKTLHGAIQKLMNITEQQQTQIEQLQIQNQTQQTLLEQLQQRIQALENK